ncbi:MAG: 4Fe-4S binding protein [Clostridiaceae bacterium]|nr:4Fe-4S binding protein [Clostridiaceae bacterium]
MAKIIINQTRCKGCYLCMNFCPKKIIGVSDKLNEAGYYPCEAKDEGKCTGCASCANICPDCAIEIYK